MIICHFDDPTVQVPRRGAERARRAPFRRVRSAQGNLSEAARLDLVHEATDLLLRDERARLNPGRGLPHVVLSLLEGLQSEARSQTGIAIDLGLHFVVAEGLHPAVRVVDEDDLFGPE